MTMGRRSRSELLWWMAVLVVSTHFAIVYHWHNVPYLNLRAYAEGQERVPFQYRVLMVWLLRSASQSHAFTAAARYLPKELPQGPYGLVLVLSAWIGSMVSLVATRNTIEAVTGDRGFARWSAFLVIGMVYFNLVLAFGLTYTLPYDLPSLAFFCLGIALVVHRQWWIYYPVFILATLNRETFCFMMVFFAAWEWARLERKPIAARLRSMVPHLLAQGALWGAIKVWLHNRYRNNPVEGGGNGLFALQFSRNLHLLMHPAHWILFLSLFGFLWIPLLLGRRWIGNRGIALASAWMIPLWIVAMFVVGFVVEVRIFNELSALLAIVAALECYHRLYRKDANV